jgi:NAD(P)-dependent dehydrogenase (short-subunit alcohol dehydrogenase family)
MALPAVFEHQGFIVLNGTEGMAPSVILRAIEGGATVAFGTRPGSEGAADQLMATASAAGLGDRVSCVVKDLADEQTVEDFMDTALGRLPELNVLIYNLSAGAAAERTPLADVSLLQWNQLLASDLRLPFIVARRAIEEFLFSRVNGRIVYIAYAGKGVGPHGIHAVGQAGLYALVRCVSKEFGKRELGCNAVVVHEGAPSEPAGQPQPVETVLFLASGESSFVNGELLDVEGS